MDRIKLTDEDIQVDQFSGVIPNGEILIKIYCKEMVKGTQLKKQILDDYMKADDWEEMNKEALKFRRLWEEKLQENKQLKELSADLQEKFDLSELIVQKVRDIFNYTDIDPNVKLHRIQEITGDGREGAKPYNDI